MNSESGPELSLRPVAADEKRLLVDKLMPGYRLVGTLGSGATSTVFLGVQLSLGRKVVIKLIALQDADLTRRFLREARILARVDDPGVSKLLDFGADETHAFLVSAYEPGKTLQQLIDDQQRCSWREVALVGAGLARALGAAHDLGVVHRDVKPANVVITDAGSPLLIDFGICRVQDESTITQQGHFVGTPIYAAPEQFSSGVIDARTDLYSLGVTLLVALTGFNPFRGGSLAEIVDHQLNLRFSKLPHAPEDTPPLLESVILHLLEKDPRRRPESGRTVALTLEGLLDERAQGAAAPSRRRKLPATADVTADLPISRPRTTGRARASRALTHWRQRAAAFAAVWALVCCAIWWVRHSSQRPPEPEPVPVSSASPRPSVSAEPDPLASGRARIGPALAAAVSRMQPLDDLGSIDAMIAAAGRPAANVDPQAFARRLASHRWARALAELTPMREPLALAFPDLSESEQRAYLAILPAALRMTRADYYCRYFGLERADVLTTLASLPGIRSVPLPPKDLLTTAVRDQQVSLLSEASLPADLWRNASELKRQVPLPRVPGARRLLLAARIRTVGAWNSFVQVTIRASDGQPSLVQVAHLFPDPEHPTTRADRLLELCPAFLRARGLELEFAYEQLPVGMPFGRVALDGVGILIERAPR